MISFIVIMICEFGGGAPQGGLAEQEQFGQALAFNGAHPSLGKSIYMSAQMHRMEALSTDLSESFILTIHCFSRSSKWLATARTGAKTGFGSTTRMVDCSQFQRIGPMLLRQIRSS